MNNRIRPIHPGEILREEYLLPMGMSSNAFAKAIGVTSVNRVTELVREKRSLTADMALRLARALGTSAEFWMNLQKLYELRVAETSKQGKKIGNIRPLRALPHA